MPPVEMRLRPVHSTDPASSYVRERDLPSLVALWPSEITDGSEAGCLRVLAKLRRALRAERQRGVGAHWAYDLARHRRLLEAYRFEARAAIMAGKSSQKRP
jgi:hypothetical protein